MIFLIEPDATSQSYKILLIASEIIIPIIVFVGVYFIFKPVFGKSKDQVVHKADPPDDASKRSSDS